MTTIAVNALFSEFGRRERRFFRGVQLLFQFLLDALIEGGFGFCVPNLVLGKIFFVTRDRIARFPVLEHLFGYVFGGIVLGVTLHAHRFRFDEHRTITCATAVDGLFRGLIDRDDVISIDDRTRDAVSLGAIRQVVNRYLLRDRSRI